MHLPVFTENRPQNAAIQAAVAVIRDHDDGKALLHDPDRFLELIDVPLRDEEEQDNDEAAVRLDSQ